MDNNTSAAESAQQQNATVNLPSTIATEATADQDFDSNDGPQLTDALEALLGGLHPPAAGKEPPVIAKELASNDNPEVGLSSQVDDDNKTAQDEEVLPEAVPSALIAQITGEPVFANDHLENNEGGSSLPEAISIETKTATEAEDIPMQEGLAEVAEQGIAVIPPQTEAADIPMGENTEGEGEHPEWEVDSSPIESSSDDSSDDSSSDDSEDGDNAYKLLSPEEQARILMADGGSDDEGGGKGKGGNGGQLRTKNEVPEVIISKPDVTITPEMVIVKLGAVETIVENIALIKGTTSGEYRVLESGSVLCLEDRSVIGAVAEPLGRVQQPLYSILFTNAGEVKAAGLSVGTNVFYTEKFATFVFTQALKAYKGSDASNIHDEEVGDDEMEFSDDEAEMEHKRKVKQARRGTRGRDSGNRGGHPLQQQHDANSATNNDEPEDGPYRPLVRPAGLINSLGHGEAPQEQADFRARQNREHSRGGRGDHGRGRGDRGRGDRGRGDRGRGGRGNFQNRGGQDNGNGYSQPPQNRPIQQQQPGPAYNAPNGYAAPPTPNFYNMPQQQFSPHQPQFPAWPQHPPPPQPQAQPYQQAGFHQAFEAMLQQQMQNTWRNTPGSAPPAPQMPGGAFFNPAFFGTYQLEPNNNNGSWNQQNQDEGGGQGGNGGVNRDGQ